MLRGELKNKGIAALITIVFIALVRPDPVPGLWETAFVSILMYTTLEFCICHIQRTRKKHDIILNLRARKADAERLEEMVFSPYKEVICNEENCAWRDICHFDSVAGIR